MLKKVIAIVKKIVFAFLLLYGLNVLVNSLNITIPINIFSLGIVSFLGVPGLVSLVVIFFIIR